MPHEPPPDFDALTRWVAARGKAAAPAQARAQAPQALLDAARAARDAMRASVRLENPGNIEVLELLAAASRDEESTLPEMTTARGFRVSLVYDEGLAADSASICVLVQCPPQLKERLFGKTVHLWNGAQRIELGQFDADGKAIGTLPAGLEITVSDFARGQVKLEEPDTSSD